MEWFNLMVRTAVIVNFTYERTVRRTLRTFGSFLVRSRAKRFDPSVEFVLIPTWWICQSFFAALAVTQNFSTRSFNSLEERRVEPFNEYSVQHARHMIRPQPPSHQRHLFPLEHVDDK